MVQRPSSSYPIISPAFPPTCPQHTFQPSPPAQLPNQRQHRFSQPQCNIDPADTETTAAKDMDDSDELGDYDYLHDFWPDVPPIEGTRDQIQPLGESETGLPSEVFRNDSFFGNDDNLFGMAEGFENQPYAGGDDDQQAGNDLSSTNDISNMPEEAQIGNPEENTADRQLPDASGSVIAPNNHGLFNMNGHPPVVPVENSTVSPAQLQLVQNNDVSPAQPHLVGNNTASPAQLQLVQNNTASPAQPLPPEQQQQLPIFQQQQHLGLDGLQQVQLPAQLNHQQQSNMQQLNMQQLQLQQHQAQQLQLQQYQLQQHQAQQHQMYQSLHATEQRLLKIRDRVYPIFDSCKNLVSIIDQLNKAGVHNQVEILTLCQITDQTYSAVSHWKTLFPAPLTPEALQNDPPLFGIVADSYFDIALFKALSVSRDLKKILERVQSDRSLWGYDTHQRTADIRRAIVECHMVTLHIFCSLLSLLLLDINPTGMGLAGLGQGQRHSSGATRFNFKQFVLQTIYNVIADQLRHARFVLPTLPQSSSPQRQEQQVPITAEEPNLNMFEYKGGQVRLLSPQETLRRFLGRQQALQSQNSQQLSQQQPPVAFQSGTGEQLLPRPTTFTHATDTEIALLEIQVQNSLYLIQQSLLGQNA